MLADRYEDGRRQGHVEDPVGLGLAFLELLQMVLQVHEGLVLVVLTRDVRAQFAKLLQLALHGIRGGLHVGLDAREILGAVHLGTGIADDPNSRREEFIAILVGLDWSSASSKTYKAEEGRELFKLVAARVAADNHTVFFLARSPEAPSTTMTVLSVSSMLLVERQPLGIEQAARRRTQHAAPPRTV
jgi:hypothetical protein